VTQTRKQAPGATAAWILVASLGTAAAYVLWPLLPAVIVGAWLADLAKPLERRLTRRLGVRSRAAAAVTTALVLVLLAPIVGLLVVGGAAASQLVEAVRVSTTGRSALGLLVSPPSPAGSEELSSFVFRYAVQTWSLATALFRGVSGIVLRSLVLVVVVYGRLAHGERLYAHLVERIPAPRRIVDRMRDAFNETGHALLVGMGGTALVQGAVATLVFFALGILNAPVLGALTVVCAFVPVVGTALVWVPVAMSLALADRWGAAAATVALGAGVIAMLDNVVRPILTRRASMRLPAIVVLLGMVGGLLALGFRGIVIGPLVVRLASEAFDALRDERSGKEPVSRVREEMGVTRDGRETRSSNLTDEPLAHDERRDHVDLQARRP
jgi:predicted PurR-regulated permease PerM